MSKIESLKDRKFVFGSIQIVANKMDTLLERDLKEYDITFKQWFLTIVVENSFDSPPTIKETAKAMGTSHQNVKQIALKLEQKGLIALEKDKKDARVTRIRLTDLNFKLTERLQTKAAFFTENLFLGITEDEMAKARIVLYKMMSNLAKLELNDR
ncbi:MAG: MarR family transcriptional regulator [Clostridiaceae bacterium]